MSKKRTRYAATIPMPIISRLKISPIEITLSTSTKGAIANIVSRSMKGQRGVGKAITRTIKDLENYYGGIEKFVYEIETEILDAEGYKIKPRDPYFREAQKMNLALEIAEKTGLSQEKSYEKASEISSELYKNKRR